MKAASDNADKLIRDYTRLANNARQSEITQQISEIVGGADALAPRNDRTQTLEQRQKHMTTAVAVQTHQATTGEPPASAASRASPARSSTSSSRTTRSPRSTTP